jgi:CRP-like cAMP-binding protein/GNAT superfamily N-acetyltransferase
MELEVRLAEEQDVAQIRDIFIAVYGKNYPYKEFYDPQWIKRSIFNDQVLMLVAEDPDTKQIGGTASVVFEIGAHSDLVGEFGRLAVHPDFRQFGIGNLLMEKRMEAIQDRLHLGLVQTRVIHPYAQKISLTHGFAPVGFLPLSHTFSHRESMGLFGRYFCDALTLRNNNPRIIPEVYPLANLALANTGLPCDVIVDEESAPYPYKGDYQFRELTARGYPRLLRIERGRVRNREIFGHMRLEYGFFKLQANHANYVLASDNTHLVGAVGFTLDQTDHSVRVFELITFTDEAIRFLLSELERKCRQDWDIQYIEIDVSAHSPRMQRTLLELNFMPAAYVPAMVFHEVERLDIVRMVRLLKLQDLGPLSLTPSIQEIADVVMGGFYTRSVTPRIAQVVSDIPLFHGLNQEQVERLASTCMVQDFKAGETVFRESDPADRMFILLEGQIIIGVGTPTVEVGRVKRGETLGEFSLLSSRPRTATATTQTRVEAAVLSYQDLGDLVRRRPDIGVMIYRNLGVGLGEKLLRSDQSLREQALAETEFLKFTQPISKQEQ